MQKVVSVNIKTTKVYDSGYCEMEFPIITKYLEEGYVIKNSFATVCPQSAICINITFILDDQQKEGSYIL